MVRRIVKKEKIKESKPSVWIDKNGYKQSSQGAIHRVVYFNYNPATDKSWHVHHINCNKLDNSPENLIALPGILHVHIHKEIKRTNRVPGRAECLEYLN